MRRFAPLLALLGIAAALGFGHVAGLEGLHRHDKLTHAAVGALLAIVLARAFPRWSPGVVALACTLGALGLEGVQSILPGRTASWADIAAGLSGAAIAIAARWSASRLRAGRAHVPDLDQEG